MNDPGYEVPENKILVVPHDPESDGYYKDIIVPLKGQPKRDWFTSHFYYCLPLNIGNQYGFMIKSLIDFDAVWDGTDADAEITFLNDDNLEKQTVKTGFSQGIITVQNHFALKTPPGVNLMTIQPPNAFIPGTFAMTGVIECDQIRRDFTYNFKITVPNYVVKVRKGDPLGAFIPIPRYYVDKFDVDLVYNHFDKEVVFNDNLESGKLSYERNTTDKEKPHDSGRRYFNGVHFDDTPYTDHQKRVK